MDIKNLLTALTKTHSAGHIDYSLKKAIEVLKPVSKVTVYDQYITAETNIDCLPSLMLEAHIDQVAMIVTSVYDNGFLRVSPVGSIDARLLPATRVKVYGKEVLSGVFTSVPPHIKKDDSAFDFDSLYIDTGILGLEKIVSKGDLAFFDSEPTSLLNDNFCAAGLDDKAGATAVISAFLEIAQLNLPIHTTLCLTFGEELGLRGGTVAAFNGDYDLAISVDVSFGECEGVAPHKTAKLGSGAMVGISPVLNREISNTLKDICEKENIPYTLEVMGGRTGTNADVISVSKGGIKTGLVSIPLKNMHSPVEIVNLNDIEAVSKLLTLFAKEVSKND